MYCPKCGNELKGNDKFCTKCGCDPNAKIEPVNTVSEKTTTEPKRSSKAGVFGTLAIVGISIAVVLAFVVLIFVFVFKSITSIADSAFIELNKFMVPSMYNITGEKHKVCSYKFNFNEDEGNMTIGYCDDFSDKAIEKYVDHLIEKEGFELFEGAYKYNLRKETEGYVVYVLIGDNDRIYYSYTKGNIVVDDGVIGV